MTDKSSENHKKEQKDTDKEEKSGFSFLDIIPLIIFAGALGFLIWAIYGTYSPKEPQSVPPDNIRIKAHNVPALPADPDDIAPQTFLLGGPGFNKTVIVNFFASWCTPCRVEHPLLELLAEKSPAPLIGISFNDAPKATQDFLRELGNPYTKVGVDQDLSLAGDFGVAGIPATFVLGPDGTLLWRMQGPLAPAHIKEIVSLLESREGIEKGLSKEK